MTDPNINQTGSSILRGVNGMIIAAIVLAAVVLVIYLVFSGNTLIEAYAPSLVSLLVAAIFAAAPLVACFVQTVSIQRQADKLQCIIVSELKDTEYFKLANANLSSIKPASVTDHDFMLPIAVFTVVIVVCSMLSLMGIFWSDSLRNSKTAMLGGLYILGDNVTPEKIGQYQSQTLVVATVAFFGAYLALFKRLLDQLNNNDIYPISFYYYSLWLLTAMTIAAVARHFASVLGPAFGDSAALLLVAFAIGAAPTPFFSALLRSAFNRLKILGDKSDPDRDNMPSNLNLLMIDGLANEKIGRLSELEITDAQILSCQNPFTLWVRLPYDFGLIVDWISQAQLYVCLREEGFRKARAQEISDIHKFVQVMSSPAGAADLCNVLELKPSFVAPILASLNENPCIVRLREVNAAMIGKFLVDSSEATVPVAQLKTAS
jgi:hypothetical protein